MPIDLGLTRINKLIRLLQYPFPWRAIHVAGTNGKGSICAYISSALTHSNLCTGRFTSPHLLDRWDCISINERPIPKNTFLSVEGYVKRLSIEHGVDATEFEILTATAFEVFSREKVQVAVIEVGIGGRGDATNVFLGNEYGEAGKEVMTIGQKEEQQNQQPVVTVITKIGMDHEGFLGKTIGEIAWQKAGIIKTGVPVVIDGSNSPEALTVIEEYSKEVKSGKVRSVLYSPSIKGEATKNDDQRVRIVTKELGEMFIKVPLHGGYQYQNTRVACEVLSLASHTYSEITPSSVATGIEKTRWPGRLDWVDLTPLIPGSNGRKVLLDGAHNPQAAKELGKYVNELRRRGIGADGVNWVIGVTKGKNADEILRLILIEGDRVFAVPFEKVDGMPWVQTMETKQIVKAARGLLGGRNDICDTWECGSEVEGLEKAVRDAEKNDRMVVVAGSLYLVGSVLRKVREKTEGRSSTDTSN